MLLTYIGGLGITANNKSCLAHTQRVAVIGMELDSVLLRARLSTRRVQAILSCQDHFRQVRVVSALTCQRLLGLLMAGLIADSPGPAPSPASSMVVQLPLAVPEAPPPAASDHAVPWGIEVAMSFLSLRWGGYSEIVPPVSTDVSQIGWGWCVCDQGQVGCRLPLGRQAHLYTRALSCTAGPSVFPCTSQVKTCPFSPGQHP